MKKSSILFLFTCLISFQLFCQGAQVTIEDTPINIEAERDTKHFRKLDKEIGLIIKKLLPSKNNHDGTAEGIKKFIAYNLKLRGQISSSGIDGKCRVSESLKKKWIKNYKKKKCDYIERRVRSIDEKISKAKNDIKQLNTEEKDKLTEEIKENQLKIDLDELNTESNRLDDLLKKSDQKLAKQNNKNKKFKSIDDLLNSKKTNKKGQSFSKKFGDKNKKNSLSNKSTSKSFTKKYNIKSNSDDTSFEIIKKGEYSSVISSKGKILIPNKKWKILQFKYGIAEVELLLTKKNICNATVYVYKTGFVNETGNFVHNHTIDFFVNYSVKYGPVLTIIPMYTPNSSLSNAENYRRRVAFDRKQLIASKNYERRKKREEKERELKNKKCKIEINNYKSSALYTYK